MSKQTYYAWFHHTAGGDSLLPPDHRGYYDDFHVAVEADSTEEAESLAFSKMYDDRSANHPDFVDRAVDDLCVELYIDPAGETPAPRDD